MNLYIQNSTSGDVYAVQTNEDNKIVTACGELHHSEVTAENLNPWNFDNDPQLVEWLNDNRNQFHTKNV